MVDRLLIQVDLDHLQSTTQNGLDLRTISYFDTVNTIVTPSNYKDAKAFLERNFRDFTTYCDATALDDNAEDAISLLNNGAAKIFVTLSQFDSIVEGRLLGDLSRLIVSFDHDKCMGDPESVALEIRDEIEAVDGDPAIALAVKDVHDWALLDTMKSVAKGEDAFGPFYTIYVTLALNTWDEYVRAVSSGHIPIVPAKQLTVEPLNNPHLIPAWHLITTIFRSDRPDGLFPTVVTDEHGVCLGLVYSNPQSIEVALQTGRGVFWSRSRDQLWIKGEESGDTQGLISIRWDCDADALQFIVRQHGDGTCISAIDSWCHY